MSQSQLPPKVAQILLHWVLPANIRDQVIGDLFEEFNLLIDDNQNVAQADYWFWQQSARTALLYLWKERGGIMAFVVSIAVFFGFSMMAMWLGGGMFMFVDIPSFLIVVPPAVAFGIAASSVKAAKEALAFAFVDQLEVDSKDAQDACRFLKVTGNTAAYLGFFTTLIGWVAMGNNISAAEFGNSIGPAFAVSILTVIYGMAVKLLCYTAEQKLQFRYL
ncbi:MAG: hypothetical protein ACI9FJ_001985 [Alteromonadaceae bacterium]|jgi:hypothetical protein